ncbi:hypothetical protein CMV_021667 [Castanea mollissima]|uniref:Pre-mRNA-splicing factor Syf1/CRNKL1-like C-terminal HAT-repeats domain-containing protein n=1 Tax=Castanea mollissima TaxID=60419 RepID=A0A8J4VCE0_9ROSI|nr:hypothetical protein CMV_021667 [Castanea mollissima]
MELRHQNFKGALELMRRATAEPSVAVKRTVAADGIEPVQIKLYRSLKLWTFYVDLEESLGTLESTRIVYKQILDLRTATPQIILNYAFLLEEHKYFEDAFKAYERGAKLERARELFEHAVETAPADAVKPLYLQYAKLEEDYGLAKRAMKVYDQATKAVPNNEKVQHRNEDTFREMLRIKRSVSASYIQTHFILPEYLMQKDQRLNLDDARDKLKQAGVAEDEMAALEMQLAPVVDNGAAKDKNRRVGFVSAGVESQSEGDIKVTANHEDIELPEESDSDDDDKVEIA